jgi:hypothetical protein
VTRETIASTHGRQSLSKKRRAQSEIQGQSSLRHAIGATNLHLPTIAFGRNCLMSVSEIISEDTRAVAHTSSIILGRNGLSFQTIAKLMPDANVSIFEKR